MAILENPYQPPKEVGQRKPRWHVWAVLCGLGLSAGAFVVSEAFPIAHKSILNDRLRELPVERHAAEVQRADAIDQRILAFAYPAMPAGLLLAAGAWVHRRLTQKPLT
jgi:hypothetical protein